MFSVEDHHILIPDWLLSAVRQRPDRGGGGGTVNGSTSYFQNQDLCIDHQGAREGGGVSGDPPTQTQALDSPACGEKYVRDQHVFSTSLEIEAWGGRQQAVTQVVAKDNTCRKEFWALGSNVG